MTQTLRQFASIFDYYSDQITDAHSDSYFTIWLEIDKNIKRLYSIGQVLEDSTNRELVYPNFAQNFQNFCNRSLEDVISLSSSDKTLQKLVNNSKFEEITNVNISDSTRITFSKFYTHIIVNLNNLGYLDQEHYYTHIFFVIENFEKIQELLNNKTTTHSALNLYCNFLYGRLPKADGSKVKLVAQFISERIQKITACYFADVDIFFFKNSTSLPDLDDFLGILGLPYLKEQVESAVFITQKKYFIKLANGQVNIRGFPELSPKQLETLGIK